MSDERVKSRPYKGLTSEQWREAFEAQEQEITELQRLLAEAREHYREELAGLEEQYQTARDEIDRLKALLT